MTQAYKLKKQNGEELELVSGGDFYIQNLPGFGNPDIQYETQKSFYQDGESVTNFTVNPRNLSFDFVAQNGGEDMIDFWNLRRQILSWLTPLSGPMTFEITLDDHTVYELNKVYPTNGLALDGNTFNTGRNDGRIQEGLRLTAFDPIWKQTPIISSASLSPVESEELVFPAVFPIKFGSTGGVVSSSITYTGTWRSYPKITVEGPYSTLTATNLATGASFQLIQEISTGDRRIIDLTDPISGFSVVDAVGANKIKELNLGANLTEFYLKPDATNNIEIVMSSSGVSTSVVIEYYNRLLGI